MRAESCKSHEIFHSSWFSDQAKNVISIELSTFIHDVDDNDMLREKSSSNLSISVSGYFQGKGNISIFDDLVCWIFFYDFLIFHVIS